jgi:hypothetical protein
MFHHCVSPDSGPPYMMIPHYKAVYQHVQQVLVQRTHGQGIPCITALKYHLMFQ